MRTYDNLLHFEKLLDEFESDALAADNDNSNTPSASKRHQRDLTRRNIVAFVTELAIENDKLLEDTELAIENDKLLKDAEPGLKEERDLLWQYLYDAMIGMSPYALSVTSRLSEDYCKVIINKSNEYKP